MIKKFLDLVSQYSTINSINRYSIGIKQKQLPSSYSRLSLTGPLDRPKSKRFSTMDSILSTKNSCNLRIRAHEICQNFLGGSWAEISSHEMSFVPISGGMSNLLFCCSLPENTRTARGEPSQVLLRLYGDQSKKSDMSVQLKIFNLLSLKDLGPKLYGDFSDGRLEEFLPASSLTSQELTNPDISSMIAKKLASVHSLDVPLVRGNDWLISKYIEYNNYIKNNIRELNGTLRPSTIKVAHELLANDYSDEIKFLRSVLDRTCSPVVFSHNDLHQGNILLARHSKRRSTLDKRLILIDFEYCGYNFRAFDIANHFCEWCFEYDTPDYPHFMFSEEKLPSQENQLAFIRSYSDQFKRLTTISKKSTTILNNKTNKTENGLNHDYHKQSATNGRTYSNGIINKKKDGETLLEEEIKPFFMAANLLWTLWCIKAAHTSNIKFGYWEHAMTRWRLYLNFKKIYMNELESQQNNGSNIA